MSEIILKDGIEFKPCVGLEAYAASKCGKIIRVSTGKYMSLFYGHDNSKLGRRGVEYKVFRTCVNNKTGFEFVHKAVARAWLENDDPINKVQVNHKDGNKLNNQVENLEWCTRAQNQQHAHLTGLKGQGEELYNSKLSDCQVHEICKLLCDGIRVKELAEIYGVSKDIIRKIKAGDTYFHIRQLYEIPHTYRTDFSYETVCWVCENIVRGIADHQIAKNSSNPNLTTIDVKRIRYKIRYKSISDEFF